MILPTLTIISAYAKEADGEPLSKAEIEAQAEFMGRCKRFMETFNEFAKAKLGGQFEASVSRPASQPKEPA